MPTSKSVKWWPVNSLVFSSLRRQTNKATCRLLSSLFQCVVCNPMMKLMPASMPRPWWLCCSVYMWIPYVYHVHKLLLSSHEERRRRRDWPVLQTETWDSMKPHKWYRDHRDWDWNWNNQNNHNTIHKPCWDIRCEDDDICSFLFYPRAHYAMICNFVGVFVCL